jgi:arabinofuranosyltransferase
MILAIHVRAYTFLTDDSFISFRYARNLSHGYGLVFNPGGERVEGYTNLLWVLILAGLNGLGFAPERAATVLSFAATVALFGLVIRFVLVRAPRGQYWIALLPAFFLASTRSFAVWASSGLETRFFELLLVAGLLRLVGEVETIQRGGRVRFLSPWFFGAATLTRPDGLLIGGCSLLASALYTGWKAKRVPWSQVLAWWPMGLLVVASLAFRLTYYGEWLPNTYYAKVGGRFLWASGARYLAAFALEYGALLWLPGLIAGVWWHRSRRALFVPLLFAAAIVPHAVYVAAIGGDHFEYRPLDFYFPLLFVLMADGAAFLATSPPRVWRISLYAGAVVFGLAWLPTKSHEQFPSTYLPGFPGAFKIPQAELFLAPERDPVFHLPILRTIGRTHRRLLSELTTQFVGIRQEEHRLFREKAEASALKLNSVLEQGLLPPDVYVALDCVGVVPYRTNLPTLDRLGLTDAHVARTPFVSDVMAHGKYATLEYARERGVDLWSADPISLVCSAGTNRLELAIHEALAGRGNYYAADVGSGDFLFCLLPQGVERASRRMPRLSFRSLADSTIVRSYIDHFLPQCLDYMSQGRIGKGWVERFGEICLSEGDGASAAQIFDTASRVWPGDWKLFWMLTLSRKLSGDVAGAETSLERAVALLRADGNIPGANRLVQLFQALPPR